jgi:hypothetical protein
LEENDTLDLNKYQHFNIERVIQTLAYIQKVSGIENKFKLVLILFFADRFHLRRYFSFISHDDIYYALRNGPVAFKTLNVLNKFYDYFNYGNDILSLLDKIEIRDNDRIIHESETGYLSEIEMDVINLTCGIFGRFYLYELMDIVQDYPEWKRHKDDLLNGKAQGKLIVIDDFFKNPDIEKSAALLKYFKGVDPLYEEEDYLESVKELYLENEKIKNFR